MANTFHAGKGTRRILSLVQYCQRVVNTNINAVDGFGPHMAHRLVKPILRGCSAETLLRLERNTPHIIEDDEELWQDLCLRNYPIFLEQHLNSASNSASNRTFRELYFVLEEQEAQRLAKAGDRIKRQRLEAEELKKQRQVKITDKVPVKRMKTAWSNNSSPLKSLFEKTRAEANKIQRSMLGARMIPPASSKQRSTVIQQTSLSFDRTDSMPVAVTKVIHRIQQTKPPGKPLGNNTSGTPLERDQAGTLRRNDVIKPTQMPHPDKPPFLSKKDSTPSIFIPKHKASSQVTRVQSAR